MEDRQIPFIAGKVRPWFALGFTSGLAGQNLGGGNTSPYVEVYRGEIGVKMSSLPQKCAGLLPQNTPKTSGRIWGVSSCPPSLSQHMSHADLAPPGGVDWV